MYRRRQKAIAGAHISRLFSEMLPCGLGENGVAFPCGKLHRPTEHAARGPDLFCVIRLPEFQLAAKLVSALDIGDGIRILVFFNFRIDGDELRGDNAGIIPVAEGDLPFNIAGDKRAKCRVGIMPAVADGERKEPAPAFYLIMGELIGFVVCGVFDVNADKAHILFVNDFRCEKPRGALYIAEIFDAVLKSSGTGCDRPAAADTGQNITVLILGALTDGKGHIVKEISYT